MRLKKCILAGGILLSTAVLFACGNKAGKEDRCRVNGCGKDCRDGEEYGCTK